MMSMAVTGVSPAGPPLRRSPQIVRADDARRAVPGCPNGTVRCSGLNESGQLGNGTSTTSLMPVQVQEHEQAPAPSRGVAQVVTGNFFACARLANGTVDCWGDNTYGQLGNGTTSAAARSRCVVKNTAGSGPLTGVVQIAAGKYHTCARISNGTVDCWGHNGYYELGDGTNVHAPAPAPGAATAPATPAHRPGQHLGQPVPLVLGAVRRLGALLGPEPVRDARRRHARSHGRCRSG